jgi:hypothetical protein
MKTLKFLSWGLMAAMISFAACSTNDEDTDDDGNGNDFNAADTVAQNNLVLYFPFNGNLDNEQDLQTTAENVTYTFDRHSNPNSAYRGSENTFIRINNPNALRVSSITMSMWLRAQQFPGGTNFILSFINPDADWNEGYALWQEGSNRGDTLHYKVVTRHQNSSMYGWTDSRWHNTMGSAFFPSAKWFHFVYTYDAATSIRDVYLDGARVARDTLRVDETLMGPITVPEAAGHFYIGRNPNTAHEWIGNYRGDLDDLRIYNVALREEQVQIIFNAERPQ